AELRRPYTYQSTAGAAMRTVVVVPLEGGRYEVTIDGTTRIVDARGTGPRTFSLLFDGVHHEVHLAAKADTWTVLAGGRTHRVTLLDERARRTGRSAQGPGDKEIRAIMPGKVTAVLVEVGQQVEQGHGVLVIEAMKMENEVKAARTGTVRELRVKPGQAVEAGELLAVIDD
ncbi:MAG TPA: biotin/lipoyl-containing protein, partial [Candidatus Limnocylindria bacterium]|nr:biotin/lipoyl-containing protein [Candidatus Limnocylindria bacterium]